MASAALDFDTFESVAPVEPDGVRHASELRTNEDAVRVLLIEDRPQLAGVVCWALGRAAKGQFEVAQASVLEQVSDLLRDQFFDAILFDLGERTGDGAHEALDVVETLSHLVPVIVLTGTCCVNDRVHAGRTDDPATLAAREHLACERLPCAILDAIHRHRRVGQGGADPIVYRMHD